MPGPSVLEPRNGPDASPRARLPELREGLFDVPGLLERLWLARTLGARPGPPTAITGGPAVGGAGGRPVEGPREEAIAEGASAPEAAPPEGALTDPWALSAPSPPWWICPSCYLTNDADLLECGGCRRPGPRP